MLVSYITCTWNHLRFAKNWYKTLKDNMPKDVPYEIIVVDNASTDGTPEFFESCGDVKVFRNATNDGEGPGYNRAMKEAKGDFVFKSDPDVYFVGPFYEHMMPLFDKPGVGVVVGHNPGWEERKRPGSDLLECYLIPGAFFCLSRDTINKAGYWESALPYAGAEFDYTGRCRIHKIKIVRAFVPEQHSYHIKHCGRFQVTEDKALIPERFEKMQADAWLKLWSGGIGACYYYMLRDWVPEDEIAELDAKNRDAVSSYASHLDWPKGEGYLGNWGRD